jgi:hypothetical protein
LSTAQEILTDALIDINVLAPGQPLAATNAGVALRKLNDLLDSLSTDKDFIYTTTENIFSGWIPGQYKYSVGNPVGGTFAGILTAGSPTITGVTVPANLIVGGNLTDIQASIPSGTTVLSFSTLLNTVTMSANAIVSVPAGELVSFTTPGDINIPRPLRINNSYTRITGSGTNLGLDYWFDFISMERYNELGYKGVPGPWPIAAAYQPTYPLGTLWVYPNPSQAGEVHLFTDLILTAFTSLTQNVNLPQGYNRALKKLMALELCPSFGKQPSPSLMVQAKEARGFIHALNAEPVVTLRYDPDIVRSQQHDAGWIMSGGFT